MLVEGYLFSSNRWYIIVIIPKSLTANSFEYELNEKEEIKKMINNFLIINCTGKNNSIALKTDNKILKSVELFDVYEGKNISENKKSYGISFLFQDENKTLTDKQVDKVMCKLRQKFIDEFNAELRQ